jgi:hypothetical protein
MTTPTLDEVITSLVDNADFEEANSVSKARSFHTAAIRYFILAPKEARDSEGHSQAMSPEFVQQMQERAVSFIAINSTTASGAVRFLGPGSDFR